jgi:SAM-dependent methyltransferase
MKVLVIRFSSIGDVVLTRPVLRALREQLPNAEIHYLTKRSFTSLLENNPNIDKLHSIDRSVQEVISQLKAEKFDRVIVSCLLAHLNRPETALKEWRRVVRNGGLVTIYVPSEPGLVLRLLRTLTTARKLKKSGANARLIHYVEHRNYWITMNILIREVFSLDNIRKKRYPIPFFSWNFSLWDVYQITVSKPASDQM